MDHIAIRLAAAGTAELGFIMATERLDGYAELVGRWEEARHRAALADGRHRYFLALHGAEPIGFAILRDWAAPERVTLLRRIAVREPGRGLGRRFVTELARAVFERTDAYRFCLGLFPTNVRARLAYEAAGFVAEGVSRGSAFFGGVHRDELVMALLRPDWAARTSDGGPC